MQRVQGAPLDVVACREPFCRGEGAPIGRQLALELEARLLRSEADAHGAMQDRVMLLELAQHRHTPGWIRTRIKKRIDGRTPRAMANHVYHETQAKLRSRMAELLLELRALLRDEGCFRGAAWVEGARAATRVVFMSAKRLGRGKRGRRDD